MKFTESRKSGIRKALKAGLMIKEGSDYTQFWEILCDNLMSNHNVTPVHSLEEITLLAGLFPNRIRLYLVENGCRNILGGTVVYEANEQVIHTQYISASPEGKALGALDLLFDYLINVKYTGISVFDFGQSTENMGKILNENLVFQKEGFGGRGVIYDIYEYNL